MVTLALADYLVIACFVLLILALGFSAKLRENSMLQFFSAGRKLTLPLFVATLVSTWYGGILGVGESVSFYGLGAWLLIGVPYYVFALIYALFLAEKVRSATQISIPERLESAFGKKAGLVGAGLIFLLAVPAAHVLMLGVLVQSVTGWGMLTAILAGCALGISFLYRGGLLADVRVAFLAFVMMYVGFGVMVAWCLIHYPLPGAWKAATPAQLSLTGGASWPAIVSFFILGAWTIVDPAFHQRVASAETPLTGRRGVLVSIAFWFLFDLLSIAAAMYALTMVKLGEGQSPLLLYSLLAEKVLPPGLKAVFFCGMLGTILSAMVGYTLVSGATLGREMIARLKQGLTDAQTTNWTRAGLFVGCGIAIVLAMNIESVVALWYAWAGAVIGALLLPVCFAYSHKFSALNRKATVLSMALAFFVAVGWLVYGTKTGNPFLEIGYMRTEAGFRLVLPSQDPATVALLASGGTFSVGTLLPGLLVSGIILGIGSLFGRARPGAGLEERKKHAG